MQNYPSLSGKYPFLGDIDFFDYNFTISSYTKGNEIGYWIGSQNQDLLAELVKKFGQDIGEDDKDRIHKEYPNKSWVQISDIVDHIEFTRQDCQKTKHTISVMLNKYSIELDISDEFDKILIERIKYLFGEVFVNSYTNCADMIIDTMMQIILIKRGNSDSSGGNVRGKVGQILST